MESFFANQRNEASNQNICGRSPIDANNEASLIGGKQRLNPARIDIVTHFRASEISENGVPTIIVMYSIS